ncbi:hypothetical protein RJT34_20301 [Clitoria ternatea]|uniref:Uncharacterized protein n=1 Tax=Clitoria ternatea TaxID=43366 RepID=A0AAN9P524_CLITE
MKEAVRATEAAALIDIKALSHHESSSEDFIQKHDGVTLSFEEVEEATEEVKTSKKVREEALERVEATNRGKLAVEEDLRKCLPEFS